MAGGDRDDRPEFVSAAARLTDDGLFVADFPAALEVPTARLLIVDGNGRRRDALLFRRVSTAAGTRVWVRPSGRIETPDAMMELAVGERSLLSHAAMVLFRRDR